MGGYICVFLSLVPFSERKDCMEELEGLDGWYGMEYGRDVSFLVNFEYFSFLWELDVRSLVRRQKHNEN